MDPELVKSYVIKKKWTVWGTFGLLLFASIEFNFLNCYATYSYPFCELSFVFVGLSAAVYHVGLYFGHIYGGKKLSKND